MKTQPQADPIEKLVANYLETEAAAVDGRAILNRALATRATQFRRRRIRFVLAAAALFALAIALGVILTPRPEPPAPGADSLARQGSRMAGSMRIIAGGISPLTSALAEFEHGMDASPALEAAPAVAELAASFTKDAAHLGSRLRASIVSTLDSTGLVL